MPRYERVRRITIFGLAILILTFLVAGAGMAQGQFSSEILRQMNAPMVTYTPSNDTWVNEGSPDSSYGTDPIMLVSRDEFTQEAYSLVRFTLSSIPAGSTINNASLQLYLVDGGATPQTLTAYRVADNWSSSVTWNTRPGLGGTYASTSVGTTANLYYTWDVTSLVQAWVDNIYTNYGFAIRGPGGANWGKTFETLNAGGNDPLLVVDYSPPTPTPTITNTPTDTPTGTLEPSPTPTNTPTPTSTPDLATIGDRVWHDQNHNGLQDAGEPGIPGVHLNLVQGAVVVADNTTSSSGAYLFPDLPAGSYTVDIDPWTLPPGYLLTAGMEPWDVTLASGEDRLDIDFGYAPPATPTPTATPVPDLVAYRLEVSQGVQSLNNSVRLVAGKRTFVRFHVYSVGGIYRTTAALRVQKGGAETWLLPLNPGGHINVGGFSRPLASRTTLDRAFLFELPSSFRDGTVTLTAHLNPTLPIYPRTRDPVETNYGNNTRTETISFESVAPFNLVVYRVDYDIGGTTYSPSLSDSDQMADWVRAAYPVSQVNYLRRTLDWGMGSVDDGSLTSPNCGNLNNRLFGLMVSPPFPFLQSFVGRSTRDLRLYGMVDDGGGYLRGCSGAIPSLSATGPTGDPGVNANPTGASGWDTDGSYGDWYGGHEVGHTLNRFHAEYCGAGGGRSYPYPSGHISPDTWPRGSLSEDNALYGFNILSRDLYSRYWTDVMTYCPRQWISDFTYENMLDFLQGSRLALLGPTRTDQIDRLLVAGNIDPDTNTVDLEPLFVLPASDDLIERIPGEYAIVLKDGAGVELARYLFTPGTMQSGPPADPTDGTEIELLAIAELVPYVAGSQSVEIEGPGGTLLASVQPGSGTPTVTLNLPGDGETLGGDPIQVSWAASDPDGDALHFIVQYSPDDGQNWETVGLPTTENSLEIAAENLVSGSPARLRILATDGLHTGSDEVSGLTVPNRAPSVSILEPAASVTLAISQTLGLEALAYDADQGTMPADQVSWSSDLDGPLGQGSQLSVEGLSEGGHIITVQANDGAGGTASDNVQVTIVGDLDSLPLAPDELIAGPAWIVFEPGLGVNAFTISVDNRESRKTISWNASVDQSWVVLGSSSGSTPQDLNVSFVNTNLPLGIHEATLSLTSPDVPGQTLEIIVQVVVSFNNYLPITPR